METNSKIPGPLKYSDLFAVAGALAVLVFFNILDINFPFTGNNGNALSLEQLTPRLSKFITPNGGEEWKFGSDQEIKWWANELAPKVNIYLVNESGNQLLRTLLSETQNDGSEYWTVDVPPGRYKLQMQVCPGCASGSSWATSASGFTVTKDENTEIPFPKYPANESLVFFSPVGGATYLRNETMSIRWFGGYESWQLTLTLVPFSSSNSIYPKIIAETVQNDGRFDWNIPLNIDSGDYYLKIECLDCKNLVDRTPAYSFGYITIR